MSINEGARIVPLLEANSYLVRRMGPQVELPTDEYDRIQLLTREGARKLVAVTFGVGGVGEAFHQMKYGQFAPDFPLCADFAKVALGLMVLQAAVSGLVVRPYVYRLHYTMNDRKRHAINGFVLEDGGVLDLEPQGLQFLDAPKNLRKYDRVRL